MTDRLEELTQDWKPIKPGTYKAGQGFKYLRKNTTPDKTNYAELLTNLPTVLAFNFKDNESSWEINQQGTVTVKGEFVYYHKGTNEKHTFFKLPPGVYGLNSDVLKRKDAAETLPVLAYNNLPLDYQPKPEGVPTPYRFEKQIDADPLKDPNILKVDGFSLYEWVWNHPNLYYLSENHPAEVTYNRLKAASPTAVFMGNNPNNLVISIKMNRGVLYGQEEGDKSTGMGPLVNLDNFLDFDPNTTPYRNAPRYINFWGTIDLTQNQITPELDNIRYFHLHKLPKYFVHLFRDTTQPNMTSYTVKIKRGEIAVKNKENKGVRYVQNANKLKVSPLQGQWIAAPLEVMTKKGIINVTESNYNKADYQAGSEEEGLPQLTLQGSDKYRGYNAVLGFKDYIVRENHRHNNYYTIKATATTPALNKLTHDVLEDIAGGGHKDAKHFFPERGYAIHHGFYNCTENGTRFQDGLINFPYNLEVYTQPIGKAMVGIARLPTYRIYSNTQTYTPYNPMVFGGGNNQDRGFYPLLVDGYVKDNKGYYNVTTESAGPLAETLSLPMNYYDDRVHHYYRSRERPFYHKLIDDGLLNNPVHFEDDLNYAGYKGRRLKLSSTLPMTVTAMGNTFKLRDKAVFYPESVYPLECYADKLYPTDDFIHHLPRLGYNYVNLYFNQRLYREGGSRYLGSNGTASSLENWLESSNNNSTKGYQALIPCNPMGQIGINAKGDNPLIFDESKNPDYLRYWKDTNEYERDDLKDRGIIALRKSTNMWMSAFSMPSFEPELWDVANTEIGSTKRDTNTNVSDWLCRGQNGANSFLNFYRAPWVNMERWDKDTEVVRAGKMIAGYPIVGGAFNRLYRHAFMKRRSVPNDTYQNVLKYDDTLSRLGLPLKPQRLIIPGFIPNPIPLCDLFTTNVDKIRWKTQGDKWLRPFIISPNGRYMKVLAPFEIESHGYTTVIKPRHDEDPRGEYRWLPLPLDLDTINYNSDYPEKNDHINVLPDTNIDAVGFNETHYVKYEKVPSFMLTENGQATNETAEMTYNGLKYHVVSANVFMGDWAPYNGGFKDNSGVHNPTDTSTRVFLFADPANPNDLIVVNNPEGIRNHNEIRVTKISRYPDSDGITHRVLSNGKRVLFNPIKRVCGHFNFSDVDHRVAVKYEGALVDANIDDLFVFENVPLWTLNDVDVLRGLKEYKQGCNNFYSIYLNVFSLRNHTAQLKRDNISKVVEGFGRFIHHAIVDENEFLANAP